MPKLFRTFVLLVAAVTASTLLPSGASADSQAKLDATRRQKAAAAAKLNALKASDAQLEKAVAALNAQVRAQAAEAQSARQALSAIESELRQTEASIDATEGRMAGLKKQLAERALAAYISPHGGTGSYKARDFNEASRGEALLSQMSAHDRDVFDELRGTRLELEDKKATAAEQRRVAAERRGAVESKLAKLRTDQAALDAQSKALDSRIKQFQSEVDGLAKSEAAIAALIRQRAAAARASRGGFDPGADGRVSGAGLVWPLRGPVTSEYGSRWGRQHTGIDISAGTGTPIRAAKGGVVILASSYSGYGQTVIIDHGSGFTTLYAHMSRIGTTDGASVSQNQVIGYVGSTGNSTGPHLHFETRVNGSPQNPRRYLP
jgi:murein DD-endopeptidase MepM/ murein hydrolase activator NlpD